MVVVVDDALYFYSLFEVLLVLMYGCITSYSYTTRSSYSVQMLVGYTILGSTLLALALVLLYTCTGTCTSTQTVAYALVSGSPVLHSTRRNTLRCVS